MLHFKEAYNLIDSRTEILLEMTAVIGYLF